MSPSKVSSQYPAERIIIFELTRVSTERLEYHRSNGRKRYHEAKARDRAEQMAQISTQSSFLSVTPSGSMVQEERDIENPDFSSLSNVTSSSSSSNYNSYASIPNLDTTEANAEIKANTSREDVLIPFGAFVPVPPPFSAQDLNSVSRSRRYLSLIVTDRVKLQSLDSITNTRDRHATRIGRSWALV